MTLSTFSFARATNGSLIGYLSALFAGAGEGKAIATRYEALRRLSDRQLASMGVARSELPQAAIR